MPKKDDPLNPCDVNKSTWFYVDKRGMLVVHEARTPGGVFIQTDQFTIPWAKVRAAINRRDKK
jgi:hypothetical protein